MTNAAQRRSASRGTNADRERGEAADPDLAEAIDRINKPSAITTATIQPALDAAIRSLNAANDAVSYADSAMRKARQAQTEAQKAVAVLEALIGTAWRAEQAAKGS